MAIVILAVGGNDLGQVVVVIKNRRGSSNSLHIQLYSEFILGGKVDFFHVRGNDLPLLPDRAEDLLSR